MKSNKASSRQISKVSLWLSHKPLLTEKKRIHKIKESIRSFNRRYDNTEIDSYAFQKVMSYSGIIEIIYSSIFQSFLFNSLEINEFNNKISRIVIDNVNQHYLIHGRKLKDESIFFEYFNELIESLIDCRSAMMSVKDCALISIISEKMYREKMLELPDISA